LIFFNLNIYFFKDLLFYVSLLSIIIGSLGALYQTKIKRLLAYSAINHIGFLLIGFLTFTYSSIFSLFFYFFVYILISINIFVVILVLRKYNNNLKLKKINEFVLIFKSYPLLAINLALILFSVAGIPPLVGFYSKLYIFVSALNSELYLLVLIAALFSVISCMYYIRLIKLMFFKKFEYWALFIKINKFESYILSIIFVFNLFFFFYPDLIILKLYFLSYIINC
jgi:NADH:ubiquinone oxidoreductase subunit 2 (subunit N)